VVPSNKNLPKEIRKGLNTLIVIVAWEIWKHWNECDFNKTMPNVWTILHAVADECVLWCSAEEKDLQELNVVM